jgi:tetratricopeptide (TPR) repeat protein
MLNFMLIATTWGPKYGGINAFNMDFAIGLANHLGENGKVFCAALSPPKEDIENAGARRVYILPIDRPVESPVYDESWAYDVWKKFQEKYPGERIDWWVGHDVTTGWAAVEGPSVAGYGQSALIMHMNYADYQAYKGGVGQRAHQKETEQRRLFAKANRCFANGPLLRDALKDIVGGNVSMLIPGFAGVPARPSAHRLHLITFGRMDRESDRIKQGGLAVAGFASAIKQAWSNIGLPEKLKENPQMRVIGIKEPDGDEEHALKSLAFAKAGRQVNLIALTYDENRAQLFGELGRANISLMLSWHEGFGLTGWEAVAGEVPLIVSRQTGLWQLLKETFDERFVDGYVRTIDIRGHEGDDDTANFLPEDEAAVRDAIIDCAAHYEEAHSAAVKLKQDLRQKWVCTWEHTARQFYDGLGIEAAKETGPRPPEREPPSEPEPKQVPRSEFIAIPRPSWPEELSKKGIKMPDSMLLRPESRVVRFHRLREPLRDTIIEWALNLDQLIKLRLQAGEGGAGKTRLLIEVCDQLERHDWRAGFVDRSQSIASGFSALLNEGKPCLVVLDYAESRTNEIVEFTRTALHAPRTPYVRLVLLAREGGDWWDRLADAAGKDQAVSAVLRGFQTKAGPYRMAQERIEKDDRAAIFDEALQDFAASKKLSVPATPAPDLSDDLFGNPLFIHLAALANLGGQPSVDDKELLKMALGHERSYWRQLLNDAGIPDQMMPALEQAIALLTLCGGKRSAKEAKAFLARTPRLRELEPLDRVRLFDALRRLYPLEGGLAGLQPDLLGETLVSDELGADDELLDAALGEESSREDVRYALTVLTRLGRRVPEQQQWLERALERYLVKVSEDALHVGIETGSPMPEVHAKVIRAAERQKRRRAVELLGSKLPTETLNLASLSIEIKQQAVAFLEDKKIGKGAKRNIALFEALFSLSRALGRKGLLSEAADAAAEAAHHAGIVFRSDKEEDLRRLAMAFRNFGVCLTYVGRFEEALETEQRTEDLFRKLAEKKPNTFTADWTLSLNNLGASLKDVGRYEEALQKVEKAERIARELADRQPDAFADWARLRRNLAGYLREVGRFEEALQAAEHAEGIWRGLVEQQPDPFTEEWATSIGSISQILRDVGRSEEALQKGKQAEGVWRGLAEKQPDAYTANWAGSLGNLGLCLRDVGRFEEALQAEEKAEVIRRALAKKQPAAHTAVWAESLGNLAEAQLAAKQFTIALDTAKETIFRIRPFADRYPLVYKPWLGFAHRVSAESHLNMDRPDEAIVEARRSADIWTEIAALRQNFESTQVAKTLRALMKSEIALGQNQAAIVTLGRAFNLLRKPLDDNPRPLRPVMSELVDLALSVDAEAVAGVVPSELLAIVRGSP